MIFIVFFTAISGELYSKTAFMKLPLFPFLLVSLIACRTKQESTKPTVQDISESVYASGTLKSENQYQVYSTTNGIIKTIFVKKGDSIKKGAPLLTITSPTSALNAKNAQLSADYARLSANTEKLEELKIAIDLAKSKMENDSLLLRRQKNLWQQQIGTRTELEQRELAYKNSVTAFRSSQIQYSNLFRQLKLNARQTQNTLKINNALTDEYTLRSEIDGRVFNLMKEPGELVTSQNPVAIIGDNKSFILELQVDEYDITRIKLNQKVLVSMDSYKGAVFEAFVTKINPIMNERSKSFTIEARFSNPPATLYPFLTAEANIVIESKKNALTIPRDYLIDDAYVLTSDNAKKRIKTGLKDYQKVEVTGGLTADESILKPTN